MEELFISLLPFIIGAAIVPLQTIINLLLLKSPNRGLFKSIAFVSGMIVTRLLQGLVFGLILSGAAEAEGGSNKSAIRATLLLVLGILLLIAAYKKWSREPDPDNSPPKWLTAIDNLTPIRAFEFGLGLPLIAAKLWVFTLSALTTIAAAQLGQPNSAIAYLLFVLLTQAFVLLPILIRILIAERSKHLLTNLSNWLTRNERPITIVVSTVFGLYFLYSGITGLLR
ncbi:GAP family protein [Leptolyngbya ohadii]|uniref:GAP family protein n=1 Tax=Leptolyngbya ohadii TaxID=1962290 RepID=UPI000B59F7AB|nr:GAP family protein [Leptolyngbya ohadii]